MAKSLFISASFFLCCFIYGSSLTDLDSLETFYPDLKLMFRRLKSPSSLKTHCKSNPWHEIVTRKRLESFDTQDWINHEKVIPDLPENFGHRVNLTGAAVTILGKYKLKKTLLQKFAEVVEMKNPNVLQEEKEIRKLGNIFCGFSQFHMSSIGDEVLESLWKFNFFGTVSGCTLDKLDVLLEKLQKKGIVGPSKTWDSQTVKRLGILVSGLPPEDFKKIRPQSMSSISPEVIMLTPPNTLKVIFTDQLQSLSRESLLQWRRSTKDSRPLYAKSTVLLCNIKLLILSGSKKFSAAAEIPFGLRNI